MLGASTVMSFYRTYRPRVLEEIDNASVRQSVELLLTKPKSQLPHAYLLSGPKGTGKTTTARVIAKLFICTKPKKNGTPCGTCGECVAIADGRYMDVLEMDAASNRGIDEIRSLRDGIALAPSLGAYKVYIIDEVHMLTNEAFNALLKTLEEPPPHAIFVLATTDPQKIPGTVVSRCQHIPFVRASTPDLMHALARIVKEEKISIDEEALTLITGNAEGSFRDAVKSLEQVSFHKGNISVAVVQKTLALSESSRRETFLAHLVAHDGGAALRDIQKLVQDGVDTKAFLVDCLIELERRLVSDVMTKKEGAIPSGLRDLVSRLTQAYGELRSSPIPQLPLELAVVEYCENKAISIKQKEINASPITSRLSPVNKTHEEINNPTAGLLTLEKLSEHWHDVIDELKPFNHSVAGVMRSTRPKDVRNGIVTIEAFYKFHQEKLSETKIKEMIGTILNKLFGEKVKVEVVLGKK